MGITDEFSHLRKNLFALVGVSSLFPDMLSPKLHCHSVSGGEALSNHWGLLGIRPGSAAQTAMRLTRVWALSEFVPRSEN